MELEQALIWKLLNVDLEPFREQSYRNVLNKESRGYLVKYCLFLTRLAKNLLNFRKHHELQCSLPN